MAFFLFVVVTGILVLRPAEIIPDLHGVSLYEYAIVACFLLALPEMLRYLTSRSLDSRPVTFCVLALLPVVVLSDLAGDNWDQTWEKFFYFFKVVIYFLLLVSLVTTPTRLRRFAFALLIYCTVLTTITVLHYHEVIDLTTLRQLADSDVDQQTGRNIIVTRLQATGMFQDPNELCVFLAAMVPLCLFFLLDSSAGVLRFAWIVPLGLFGYGIALTQSRGGFLAFAAGLAALTWARFGWRRMTAWGLLGVPLLVVLFAGRQTDISVSVGTGQTRVQLWSDWLEVFRENPLLGQGMVLPEAGVRKTPGYEVKQLAHNSYLQSFADLGLVGGTLFLGAICLALASLIRFGTGRTHILQAPQQRIQPYLVGVVGAFGFGLLFLSVNYVIFTYLIVGLAATYPAMTRHWPPLPTLRFDLVVALRLALLSFAFLACTYVFVRLFVNWA